MGFRVYYLAEDKKHKIITSWKGDNYEDFVLFFDKQKVFNISKFDYKQTYEIDLPNNKKLILKFSRHFLFRGWNIWYDNQLLKGSAEHEGKCVDILFWLFIFFGALNVIYSFPNILNGDNVYRPAFILVDPAYAMIEGLILISIALLVKIEKSRLVFVLGSVFLFFNFITSLRMIFEERLNLTYSLMEIIFYPAIFYILYELFKRYLKPLANFNWFKSLVIPFFSFALLFTGICYFYNYNFFYKGLTTSEDYQNVGYTDGYYDVYEGNNICESCVELPHKINKKQDYLDGYYEGYYWACLEENLNCQVNIPEEQLKKIKGYNDIDNFNTTG